MSSRTVSGKKRSRAVLLLRTAKVAAVACHAHHLGCAPMPRGASHFWMPGFGDHHGTQFFSSPASQVQTDSTPPSLGPCTPPFSWVQSKEVIKMMDTLCPGVPLAGIEVFGGTLLGREYERERETQRIHIWWHVHIAHRWMDHQRFHSPHWLRHGWNAHWCRQRKRCEAYH